MDSWSGHISPEAALGGPLALVKNGDEITIDAERREISLHVSAAELKRRRKTWMPPKPYARRGALAKYAKQVSSASLGRGDGPGMSVAGGCKSCLQCGREMCQSLYLP